MIQQIYEELSTIPGITDHFIMMFIIYIGFALGMVLINEAIKNTFTNNSKRTTKEKKFWKKFCLFSGFFTGTLYGYFFGLFVLDISNIASIIDMCIFWFAVGLAFIACQTAIYHFGKDLIRKFLQNNKNKDKNN